MWYIVERIDFANLDERTMGMFWVLSFTMAPPAVEAVMNWFTSTGVTDLLQVPSMHTNEQITIMRETFPVSMTFLSGLSFNMCLKLAYQLEETIFLGQVNCMFNVERYMLVLVPIQIVATYEPSISRNGRKQGKIMILSDYSSTELNSTLPKSDRSFLIFTMPKPFLEIVTR